MYDYDIKTTLNDGTVRVISYQKMLGILKMEDEIVMGAPLSEGGTPQVAKFISMLKGIVKAKNISAFYNGNELLKV